MQNRTEIKQKTSLVNLVKDRQTPGFIGIALQYHLICFMFIFIFKNLEKTASKQEHAPPPASMPFAFKVLQMKQ